MLTSHSRAMLFSTIIVMVVIAVHSAMLFFPPVNFEFAFADAARYFNAPANHLLLDEYFDVQANTVALPYFAAVMARVFPGIEALTMIRVINLMGIALLGIGIFRICTYLKIKHSALIVTLVLLNPIVWTYSGRATADFLPMAVGIFAISLMLGERYFLLRLLSAGIMLGLGAIFKYHTLCVLVFLAALLARYRPLGESIWKTSAVAVISIAMVGLYLVKAHAVFGFWVAPPKFQETHHLRVTAVFNNFILYVGFLGLCGLPTFFFFPGLRDAARKYWRYLIPALCFSFLVGMFGLHDGGELNFGPLDALTGPTFRAIVLSLMSVIALMLIFMSTANDDRNRRLLGCAVIVVLLVFSMTRPAQRYLLFLLPFLLFALPSAVFKSRAVLVSMFFLFVAGNVVIEYSRWSVGSAAEMLANKIEAANLLDVTDAGAMQMHTGDRFYQFNGNPKRFIVLQGANPKAIATGYGGFGYLRKSFSLLPIEGK
jgi:hypothetical protein